MDSAHFVFFFRLRVAGCCGFCCCERPLEGKCSFQLTVSSLSRPSSEEGRTRTQAGQEPGGRSCAETGSAAYWLVPNGLPGLFPYRTQYHRQSSATHGEPVPLSQSLAKKMQASPQAKLMGAFLSFEVRSSQMTLACVEST